MVPPKATITYDIEIISWKPGPATSALDMKVEDPNLELDLLNKKKAWKRERARERARAVRKAQAELRRNTIFSSRADEDDDGDDEDKGAEA